MRIVLNLLPILAMILTLTQAKTSKFTASGGIGDLTFFDGSNGVYACETGKVGDYYAAVSEKIFGNKAHCGKCARVYGPKGSVVVKLVDMCVGCAQGDLDVSPEAFEKIADKNDGRIPSTRWSFVPCNQSSSGRKVVARRKSTSRRGAKKNCD